MAANSPSSARANTPTLHNVLADYLANAPAGSLPGVDGICVEDAVRDYSAAAAANAVPGEVELCERHPNLAPQVVAFFFGQHFDAGSV